MKNHSENTELGIPVNYLNIQEFTIPEGNSLTDAIIHLKKEKRAAIIVEDSAQKNIMDWADAPLSNMENLPKDLKTIVYYGNPSATIQLKKKFPNCSLIHWETKESKANSFIKVNDIQRLFLCLKYELPLLSEILKTKIVLSDIKIYAYHGVLPEENLIGSYYLVSLEVDVDFKSATETDKLEDTVSYAELNEIIHEEMDTPSQLIEHVGGRIYHRIRKQFPTVSTLKVSITKLNPPMKGECGGATIIIEG